MAARSGWCLPSPLRAITLEMDRRQFWPAVYSVNDHGNVTLLSGSREIAAWV